MTAPSSRSSVVGVLASYDDEFSDFASAFAQGQYLLWLGSGLSRGVVPDVPKLLAHMLEFLRSSIDPGDPDCRFLSAFNRVLNVAGVDPGVRSRLDLSRPATSWPELPDLVTRLCDKYSDVLDVAVQGEPRDFLVWVGLDVPGVYADPTLEPDVEHLCVALLMLEGLVTVAPTTNWDGLVELAMERLTLDMRRYLKVVVATEDFAGTDRRSELVKFHGCAVRAADDEANFRHRLVARRSQIAGWAGDPANNLMKHRLEHLFASRPAFIVGLSAQDANIQAMLHEASRSLLRTWPTTPPAAVFAEHHLSQHHTHYLTAIYGDSYNDNLAAVEGASLLGAYAKPALMGLVLFSFVEKLRDLLLRGPALTLSPTDVNALTDALVTYRDRAAAAADTDPAMFMDRLISNVRLILSIFRSGHPAGSSAPYTPLSIAPVAELAVDPDFPMSTHARLALGLALLATGAVRGKWELELGDEASPTDGALRVLTPRISLSRTFIVRDARAHAALEVAGIVDPADPSVLVLEAEAVEGPSARSPRSRYGRTGKPKARFVELEHVGEASTVDEMLEMLTLEGGLV